MPEPEKQPAERKSLDERNKMTELERIRHSAAHVMATAILRLWPEAQFAAGPPVENGFYYDVELSHRISPEDFEKIEAEMKKEIKANHPFEKIVVERAQAIKDAESGRLGGLAERPGNPSKFKLGNLADIPEGEPISYYRNGDFLDLCAGPHVMRTGNIGAFKLTSVASAYYKGDEKNPQLQRIYGTAFKNKTEMEAYFKMLEEAKRRDHRKIGHEMGLFAMDPDYTGPGLPLWLPKGGAIIEELEKLAKETEFAAGYVRVKTPHLAREKMYKTSGHLPYYAESMFPPMELREHDEKGSARVSRAVSGVSPETSSGAKYSRRALPHFERPWAKYFVTFSTEGRKALSPKARDIVLKSLLFTHEQRRYELYAACVMPDHVHLLFEPQIKEQDKEGKPVFWPLSDILHSIKSFTAHEINAAEHTKGNPIWEKESFDRIIRGESDMEEKFHYICRNPWDSGLAKQDENYPWLWTPNTPRRDAEENTRDACAPQTLTESQPAEHSNVDRYYLKAMNCPHHHRIFAAEPRSYRDLPLRLAEYGTCYRYEQSGELFGLMRVRSLNMNDAHIYCTPEQFASEFNAVNEMYLKYFKIFGIEKYVMRFSTHGKEGLGKKYVNEPELWKQTEDMVRQVLIDSKINYIEVPNEAAFYGPKIDVQVWSVIGREFTLATNQVDFAVPKRFGLVYRDRDNSEKTPLCIHRAPLGTHERFLGFLIEHYAGNFPLWLAPEQVRVLTLGTDEPLVDYAKQIVAELRAHFVRAEADFSSNKINGKIQDAETAKVHTMLVVGPRDRDNSEKTPLCIHR
ncbi:MAG TPA: aminoacyl--tRNA ligase-related protein, partial [Verrucomicrobiae bacterium]|nr:aminoacyl--tRNA ligase-related protein [Verrucomicrobiae bacterium]